MGQICPCILVCSLIRMPLYALEMLWGDFRSLLELPSETTSIPLEHGDLFFKLSKIFPHFPHYFCLSQLYLGQHCTEYLSGTLSFISGCFCVSQLLKKTKASVQKSICKTEVWREREASINTPAGIYHPSNTGDGHVLPTYRDIGKIPSQWHMQKQTLLVLTQGEPQKAKVARAGLLTVGH